MSGCVTSSAWIGLSYVGTPNSLIATPIASAIPGNGLQLLPDGIWVPGTLDLAAAGMPASPPDGMLIKTSPGANIAWLFRFNPISSASHPWEFTGGPDYFDHIEDQGTVNTNQASGNYSVWSNLSASSTIGPVFTIPFSGIYNISFGADINPLAGEEAQAGLSINSNDPNADNTATAGASGFTSVMRRQQIGLTSGDVVRVHYRGTGGAGNASTHKFQRRWLSVTPVRIHGSRAGGTYGGT